MHHPLHEDSPSECFTTLPCDRKKVGIQCAITGASLIVFPIVATLRNTLDDKSTGAITMVPVLSTVGSKDENNRFSIVVYGQ